MAGKDLLASENTKGKDLLADSSQGTDFLSQSDQPYDINKITGSGLGGVVAGFATPEITMGLGKALQMVPYSPISSSPSIINLTLLARVFVFSIVSKAFTCIYT